MPTQSAVPARRDVFHRTVLGNLLWSLHGVHASVSLRFKIMGIAVAIVLILGLGVALQTTQTLSGALLAGLDERAVSTATDLATRATDLVLTGNKYGLYELISDTLANNRDLRYVFLLDPEGNVIAHSFGAGFPVDLLRVNRVLPGERYSLRILDSEEGFVHDVAAPIFGGKAGQIRVGFTEKPVARALASTTAKQMMIAGLMSLLAVAAAYGLTNVLTRPIQDLVDANAAVARGDLTRKTSVQTNDEVGRLGRAFNEMTESLRRSREEIENLSNMRSQLVNKVISAQEEERKRIARELHDETGQALTSLMLCMRALEGSEDLSGVHHGLEQLRSMTAVALDKVKRLSLELRPSILDDLGLVAALERYASDYSSQYGIKVQMRVVEMDGVRLPRQTEVAIYRIVQESLTNVAKHARAGIISLTVKREADTVVVAVMDNGRGFDLQALMGSGDTSARLGLFGMEERAALVGGRLSIRSHVGEGTEVSVQIPCAAAESPCLGGEGFDGRG